MKRATHLILVVLFVVVWPVYGQTPTTAVDYYNRGVQRHHAGDLDGAIADYNKAIGIDPRHATAYYNRGIARKAKGDLDGAIADYTKAIEIDPRRAAYHNRGLARKAEGDLDGAIADYTKAIEVDPKSARSYENRGLALLTKGRDQEAEQDFKKIEKQASDIKQARKAPPKP
jgi:tetratricopeptide (TPR) repeat protein